MVHRYPNLQVARAWYRGAPFQADRTFATIHGAARFAQGARRAFWFEVQVR